MSSSANDKVKASLSYLQSCLKTAKQTQVVEPSIWVRGEEQASVRNVQVLSGTSLKTHRDHLMHEKMLVYILLSIFSMLEFETRSSFMISKFSISDLPTKEASCRHNLQQSFLSRGKSFCLFVFVFVVVAIGMRGRCVSWGGQSL